jgi:hypothetical protein
MEILGVLLQQRNDVELFCHFFCAWPRQRSASWPNVSTSTRPLRNGNKSTPAEKSIALAGQIYYRCSAAIHPAKTFGNFY